MTHAIWKYVLDSTYGGDEVVLMPSGAKILSVAEQDGALVLWAKVDTSTAALAGRRIYVRPTGQAYAPCNETFVGTCLFMGGRYVVHVFDGGEVAP
mgnify:CR=1 FL=1